MLAFLSFLMTRVEKPMESRDTATRQQTFSVKTLLPAIFSAISVLTTGWIAYQNSQLTPKVNEISDRINQLQTQANETSGGVAGLQQVDEARKRQVFERLTANGRNPEEVQRAFQEVFPEDEFWADETLSRSVSTPIGTTRP